MERLSIVKEGNIIKKKICEFRARNSIKNELVFIEVEYYKSSWWYINFKNERSYKYNSINEAIDDISNMFGDWIDFKLLV